MDGLHVDYVHLEIKKHRDIEAGLHSTSLPQQSVGASVELSTDHTLPPSGICVCPLCALSRCWPGLPSGSAAGWCGTHLEDLHRSLTCHCPPAARLGRNQNMSSSTPMHKTDADKSIRECVCHIFTRVSVVLKRPVACLDHIKAFQM